MTRARTCTRTTGSSVHCGVYTPRTGAHWLPTAVTTLSALHSAPYTHAPFSPLPYAAAPASLPPQQVWYFPMIFFMVPYFFTMCWARHMKRKAQAKAEAEAVLEERAGAAPGTRVVVDIGGNRLEAEGAMAYVEESYHV